MPADAGDRSDAAHARTGTTVRNGGVRIACVVTGVPGGRPPGSYGSFQSSGGAPCFSRSWLAREKGREPKKPRSAE